MSETKEEVRAAVAEMEQAYLDWQNDYVVVEEVEYAPTAEEQARLEAAAAENRVFTYNTTCDHDILTSGFHDYSGAMCCWGVLSYFITEKPHDEQSSVWLAMSLSDFCLECNPECDEDKDETDCDECGGSGYTTYYAN